MGKKIRYHSFDFDGSLFNEAYIDALKKTGWPENATSQQVDEALLEANQEFLAGIIATKNNYNEEYVLIGSNRQSMMFDWMNASPAFDPPGSAFPRLQAIAKKLGAQLEPLLLADIEAGQPFGSEYAALEKNKWLNENGSYKKRSQLEVEADPDFAKVHDDAGKVSLLLAQIQKASQDHPKDEVEFNFHDDRINIVEGLKHFFAKNPELIPKNVVLNLHGYSGPQPPQEGNPKLQRDRCYPYGKAQQIAKIQGTGLIPKNDNWVNFYKDIRAEHRKKAENDWAQDTVTVIPVEYNALKMLSYYSQKSTPLNEIPKLAQEHISVHLKEMSAADLKKPLAQELLHHLAKYVGHAKATGRFHACSVTATERADIKVGLQNLKGDHLKREILLDLKDQIENIKTLKDLNEFEEKHIIKQSDAYKILAKAQGVTTKIFNLETDSVTALKTMIKEKKDLLDIGNVLDIPYH